MNPKAVESSAAPDRDQTRAVVPDGHSPRKGAIAWLATTVVLVAIGLASLLLGGIYRFGSAASALVYLRGDRLIPDAYFKSFGTVSKADRPSVEFRLTNYTRQPIKVIGGNASCTCLITSDLPVTIPPSETATLRVSARFKSRPGPYSERLRILTDAGTSGFVLSVRGTFD